MTSVEFSPLFVPIPPENWVSYRIGVHTALGLITHWGSYRIGAHSWLGLIAAVGFDDPLTCDDVIMNYGPLFVPIAAKIGVHSTIYLTTSVV